LNNFFTASGFGDEPETKSADRRKRGLRDMSSIRRAAENAAAQQACRSFQIVSI